MTRSYVKPICPDCQIHDNPAEESGTAAWLRERNLDLAIACPRCSYAINISLDEAKWLQEKRLGLGLICRDCGDPFLTSPDEVVWLLENNLKLFKRCSPCRQNNKENKALLEQQLEKMNSDSDFDKNMTNTLVDDAIQASEEAVSDGE